MSWETATYVYLVYLTVLLVMTFLIYRELRASRKWRESKTQRVKAAIDSLDGAKARNTKHI